MTHPEKIVRAAFRRLVLPLGLALLAGMTAPAGAQEPPPDFPEPPESAKQLLEMVEKEEEASRKAPAEAAGEAAAKPAAEDEEEREWLVDEDGQEYYIVNVPKAGLVFHRVSETEIRTRYLGPIILAGEDDEFFFQKIFKVQEIEGPKGPTEEELQAWDDSFQASIESADTVELVPFSNGLPEHGLWRHVFDVGDMNGDGHLDIVHGTPRKTALTPVIFLGDSAGNWRVWEEVSFPPAPYDYGAATVADWNGDGRADLALGMHAIGILALVQEEDGVFRRWSEGIEIEEKGHRGPPAFSSRSITSADWDGDGDPDILALAEGPRNFDYIGKEGTQGKVVYLNEGDGTWRKLEEEEPSLFGMHVLARDMNGDGRVDLVTASSARFYRKLINLNREDLSFDSVRLTDVREYAWTDAIAAADWDGDGRQDLAYSYVTNYEGMDHVGIDVLFAREDDTWERLPLFAASRRDVSKRFTAMGAGDWSGDGRADLAVTTEDGGLILYRSTGASFVREEAAAFPEEEKRAGCRGYHVVLVDLDRDGTDEILANFSGEGCRRAQGGSLRAWKVRPRQ